MQLLNKNKIRSDFSKAASTYNNAAIVQAEICERTLERLQMLKLDPTSILDIGSGTGKSVRALKTQFSDAYVVASDFAFPMLTQSKCKPAICCDAQFLPIKNASIDLIFSTSTFQWCEDLNQLFVECMRVLKKNGVLVFSTFGPDTLKELRQSWAEIDHLNHVHQFIDMHHIGDSLLANQFHDPVVDREIIVIEYQNLRQLLMDLKATGSRNKFISRDGNLAQGLLGKKKFKQLAQMYNTFRLEDDSLPATYEVIYGYARKSSNHHVDPKSGEVRVAIDTIVK